ncbi:hypothetical protein CUT44_32085 [Streptomyces carminius]|uniref:Uncharacterized protein n=1 Tax=Streptomyces carminius TaxID=2665496 RepID=A0A2M8LPR4_9ACTN|nr:hypothetical protein CUT44_32085 [Streptomyces carminius]
MLNDLKLSRNKETRARRTGATCSDEPSVTRPVEWKLSVPGRPTLTVHDNRWENGERDLTLYQPTVVPEMPAALSNLHNRLRSGIAGSRGRAELRIMLYPTYVDGRGRPRIKKSLTTEELVGWVGLRPLRKLTEREGVTLEPAFDRPGLPDVDLEKPQDEKPLQHALFFPAEDDKTPVTAFVHFRIVPVLRHIGWLRPDWSRPEGEE